MSSPEEMLDAKAQAKDQKVFLMRGLPGSGKTSWIEHTFDLTRVEIFSADDFHTFDGVYKYDPKRAAYAHNMCFTAYMMAIQMERGKEAFIVDNTNTTLAELAPYVAVANAFGLECTIMYFNIDITTAMKRGLHGVPLNTILTMQRNLLIELVPPYWKQELAKS